MFEQWLPKSQKARRRLGLFALIAPVLLAAAALSLNALKDTEIYFYTPAQLLAATTIKPDRAVRLGGLVKPGSIVRQPDGALQFVVMDKEAEISVTYRGEVPDLFREGQGVVCQGKMASKTVMTADQVLAKHDENYMPKNVQKALKEQGEWRPESGMTSKAAPEKPFSLSQEQASS